MAMIRALHFVALLAYLAAWALHLRMFRAGKTSPSRGSLAATAGLAAHGMALLVFVATYRVLPLVGLGPASSSLALAIAIFVIGGGAVRLEVRATGLFLLPLVLALVAQALTVGVVPSQRETAFSGAWFAVHVISVFAGLAGLALASAAAAGYALQFRALKRRQFGSVFRFFPSLDALDRVNRIGLLVGFPALTIGLLAGWSWTLTFGQGLELSHPQVILGIVTWVAYLSAIGARWSRRWSGLRAAMVSTGAFFVTAFTLALLRLFVGQGSGRFL